MKIYYIYTEEYYLAIKKIKFVSKWMGLENTMSEVTQASKGNLHVLCVGHMSVITSTLLFSGCNLKSCGSQKPRNRRGGERDVKRGRIEEYRGSENRERVTEIQVRPEVEW